MSKRINVRLPDDLYKQLYKKNGTMTEMICTALRTKFEVKTDVDVHCTDNEQTDLLNEIYSSVYNAEVIPLKKEIQHKLEIINMIEKDKTYLQSQNNALIMAKIPLITKLKMKLLDRKHEE